MISAVGWTTVALMTLVILVAGTTNGLAGFGFAVVGTMALATMIDPATAVVFMIIPILAVNLSLVRDLSGEQLRTCSRRFDPLIGAALVGTVVGMAVLSSIPSSPLRVGLGVLTLGFVATGVQPNSEGIGLEPVGVETNDDGTTQVNSLFPAKVLESIIRTLTAGPIFFSSGFVRCGVRTFKSLLRQV